MVDQSFDEKKCLMPLKFQLVSCVRVDIFGRCLDNVSDVWGDGLENARGQLWDMFRRFGGLCLDAFRQ